MGHCVRFKRTGGGMRCAKYSHGLRGLGDMGDLPLSVDTALAPGGGGGTALLVAALLKMFAKDTSWWSRHAGFAGFLASLPVGLILGLARGMGTGIVAVVTGGFAGGSIEAAQAAANYRIKKAVTNTSTAAKPPTEEVETPPELPAADASGTGMVRARFGAVPRGFLPANGSSPVDALRSGMSAGVMF